MRESRERILLLNDTLAQHLISAQQAKYQPSQAWEAGESVFLDESEEAVVLTETHARQLNQEDLQYYLDNRDNYTSQELKKWVGKATLISSKSEAQQYLYHLGKSLAELSKDYGNLIILGDWNTPWLSQENDYAPVAEAMLFLRQKIDDQFNGGFILNPEEIPTFISHLFWLTRCNASLPEFMMAFRNSKTIFGICKYGVLHCEFYDAPEREEIIRFFSQSGFKEVDRCMDPLVFDAFDGRWIKIDQ